MYPLHVDFQLCRLLHPLIFIFLCSCSIAWSGSSEVNGILLFVITKLSSFRNFHASGSAACNSRMSEMSSVHNFVGHVHENICTFLQVMVSDVTPSLHCE